MDSRPSESMRSLSPRGRSGAAAMKMAKGSVPGGVDDPKLLSAEIGQHDPLISPKSSPVAFRRVTLKVMVAWRVRSTVP